MGLCLRGCFLCSSLSQSLRQYPLSHGLRRASSPKGAPFGNAGKFAITAQSRPLGEGGKAVGFDGRGLFPPEPSQSAPVGRVQIPLFVAARHLPPTGGSLSSQGELFCAAGKFVVLPDTLP